MIRGLCCELRLGGSGPGQLRSAIVASGLVFGALATAPRAHAQDLTPRAYVVSPLHSNAILVTDVYSDGDLNFEGTVPIEDATGTVNALALGFYRSITCSADPRT